MPANTFDAKGRPAHPASAEAAGDARPVRGDPAAPASIRRSASLLSLVPKDGGVASAPAAAAPSRPPGLATSADRIRESYLNARFPGVVRSAADLRDVRRVIDGARLYFQDRRLDRARELLQVAVAERPEIEDLWLAHIEILFLADAEAEFALVARSFLDAHPATAFKADVAHLWSRFRKPAADGGTASPPDPGFDDHFGPWPALPDWIGAPGDLSAEIHASEIHRLALESRLASFPRSPGGAGNGAKA